MILPLLSLSTILLSLAHHTRAAIQQSDFSGLGHIYVLASSDWRTATPASKVGCLSSHGKFISDDDLKADCGVFSRMEEFPYTLSSSKGNCTFDDDSQEKNTDSKYGRIDNAWNCKEGFESSIYDELYTIVSSLSSIFSWMLRRLVMQADVSQGRLSIRVLVLRGYRVLLRC